jgi:hypothetical protein
MHQPRRRQQEVGQMVSSIRQFQTSDVNFTIPDCRFQPSIAQRPNKLLDRSSGGIMPVASSKVSEKPQKGLRFFEPMSWYYAAREVRYNTANCRKNRAEPTS